ncbi:sulfotransferase [Miltoncostaea marina]|uniref:sulfotransferase n=1 Tax=Miltoncostaea marina TaxID=2843215 RepID=UPI001C3CB832|nr:sulfotransferase [Miltoncostaea marina]
MASLAPYDELVPHPPADARLAARFAELRAMRPAADLGRVRELVVVVSSSRGGCTLLGELLRRCPSLLSLPAESNPYVVVAQLGGDDPAGIVAAELARAVGAPARPGDPLGATGLAREWAWRMRAQWPHADIAPERVMSWVREAGEGDPAATAAFVLARARGADPAIDARRYDLGPSAPRGRPPAGPPGELLVEMPPFVVPRPWRRAGDDELAARPLVIATPRNAYRVRFLAGLVPGARLRLLHLVRNPAAAVNGLLDGWRHHGFFNCRMPRDLAIRGYDEGAPWARRWWKYDVPPGWEAVAGATLAEVCALQWRSAHEAALDAAGELGADRHTVRYEDLVGPPPARAAAARALEGWLGIPAGELEPLVVEGLDPVMATAPPRPGRWRAREAELAPVLADPAVLGLAERLGYRPDPAGWA